MQVCGSSELCKAYYLRHGFPLLRGHEVGELVHNNKYVRLGAFLLPGGLHSLVSFFHNLDSVHQSGGDVGRLTRIYERVR